MPPRRRRTRWRVDDAASQAEDQVEGRLLLDVVVGQRATVFQLLAGEDQTLLIRRNAFLVLDLGLDILYGVAGFDFEGDRLPRQRLHENLHLLFFFLYAQMKKLFTMFDVKNPLNKLK